LVPQTPLTGVAALEAVQVAEGFPEFKPLQVQVVEPPEAGKAVLEAVPVPVAHCVSGLYRVTL
jgi:hypothetical protein